MVTFKDLRFKDHHGGINASHLFENKFKISVSAGSIAYSNPREDGLDSSQFLSFEVAIFDPNGDFVTGDILQSADDVVGWCSREDIDRIIEVIIAQ